MSSLIKSVKLSKNRVVVGESMRVWVTTTDPTADVMIDGIYGAVQWVQFADPGSFTVVVTVARGEDVEQVGERVTVGQTKDGDVALPIIWASQDRYQPRMVTFSVPNASQFDVEGTAFAWQFGDGNLGVSRQGTASHDYTAALTPDALYETFDVQLELTRSDGSVASVLRTISVFNTYALNKIRRGILTPRVNVQDPLLLMSGLFFIPAIVKCTFTITNLEDEDLTFDRERWEWLDGDPAAGMPRWGPISESELIIQGRATVTMERIVPQTAFDGSIFGVAIHLAGRGTCSSMTAAASAYIEVKLPMGLSGVVTDPYLARMLSGLAASRVGRHSVISHQDLSEFVAQAGLAAAVNPPAPPT
jgi:hypothetical protein